MGQYSIGADSQRDGRLLFERINRACAKFLSQSIHYIGTIENDKDILLALQKCQSVLESAPSSLSANDFRRLAFLTDSLEPITYASGVLEFFIERLVKENTVSKNFEALQVKQLKFAPSSAPTNIRA